MWHTDIESNLSCISTFDKYKTSSYNCVANTRWKLRVRNVCGVSNLKPTLLQINSRTVWSAGVSRSLRSSIGWWTPRKTSWWWGLIFFLSIFFSEHQQQVFFFFFFISPHPTGGYGRYQGVCRRWRQIFRAEKYAKGGEEHRQGCKNSEWPMMTLIIIRMLDVSVIYILGLTKLRYVETVLKAIQQCKNEEVDIDVRWAWMC